MLMSFAGLILPQTCNVLSHMCTLFFRSSAAVGLQLL